MLARSAQTIRAFLFASATAATFLLRRVINFLNQLASDDTADILNELPINEREGVLSGLEPTLKIQVTELLRYEENVAGGLMAKELIKARYFWTVVECIDEIRKQAENVNKFYAVYVVDERDKEGYRVCGNLFGGLRGG